MELPGDILSLVRDFSMPLTRPDWRTLRRMPNLDFHLAVASELMWHQQPVIYHFILRAQTHFFFDVHFFDGFPYVPTLRDLRTGATYHVTPS